MIAEMKSPPALALLAVLALAGCTGGDASRNTVATSDASHRQPLSQPAGVAGYAMAENDFLLLPRGMVSSDAVVHTSDAGIVAPSTPPALPVFDGRTGEPMTGRVFQRLLEAADVILLGEVHDDATGHMVQSRLVAAALPGPDGGGALAMEMLDRGDAERFGRDLLRGQNLGRTGLADWPNWRSFYLPAIQAARAAGRPIVASNAPREYAETARLAGYDTLEALDPDSRDLFELPPDSFTLPDYRDRFADATGGHGGSGDLDAYYDAQLLWDATMADSVADAHRRWGGPIVHLNGSFHSDFDGGLTTLLRRRGLSVLTVSLIPGDNQRLAPQDAGRARVVIYTGAPQAPSTRPSTRPTTEPFARVAPQIGEGALRPATVPATRPAPVATPPLEK